MKSKLASDLARFRQATEKIVGKERQKHVQGTGRSLKQESQALTMEQDNAALGTISDKIGDINEALIGLDQAVRDYGGSSRAQYAVNDLRAAFDAKSQIIMDEVGL